MPAAIPILVAVTAGSAIYSGIEANQERQHAKGAAQAQKTATDAQVADLTKQQDTQTKQKSDSGAANQQAALAALRAAMSTTGQLGGTILTGSQGAAPAPTAQKTLLGV